MQRPNTTLRTQGSVTLLESIGIYRKMRDVCRFHLSDETVEHYLVWYNAEQVHDEGASLMMLEDYNDKVHYLEGSIVSHWPMQNVVEQGEVIVFRMLTKDKGPVTMTYVPDGTFETDPEHSSHALHTAFPCGIVTLETPYYKKRAAMLELHWAIMDLISEKQQKDHPSAVTVNDVTQRDIRFVRDIQERAEKDASTQKNLNRIPEPWRELVFQSYLNGAAEVAKRFGQGAYFCNMLQSFIWEHPDMLVDPEKEKDGEEKKGEHK